MKSLRPLLCIIMSLALGWLLYKKESVIQASPVPLIPREVLFGTPEKGEPHLSPDGTKLAYRAPFNGKPHIWVKTIGKDDDRAITRGTSLYIWLPDSSGLAYLQDNDGDENDCIYTINLETHEVKNLTPFENIQARILNVNSQKPHDILIELNKDNPALHDLYNVTIVSGELTLLEKNPGNVMSWLPDNQGNIRGKVIQSDDGGIQVWIRETPTAEWNVVIAFSPDDADASQVISFSSDGHSIFLVSPDKSTTTRLIKLDSATGHTTVLYHDAQYDIKSTILHPKTGEIQAVQVAKARREVIVLDPSIKHDIEKIKQTEDGEIDIIDRDDADTVWTVAISKDTNPKNYYLYKRATQEATLLWASRPELAKYSLAHMEPFTLQARDGLKLEGYVTYPVGVERHNLPMVLKVHGGPWSRNTWGYNPEAQWLANRGYMCVQVNFRGSAGYGKTFTNAGDKEWGNKMHDDLIDTVKYFIDQGSADPKKVAIYGGSYGGYAALCGATFTPDIFRCAIDICGPSNLLTFLRSAPAYWIHAQQSIYTRIGNPEIEQDFLKSRSPLFSVDAIKIPLLIAQGGKDPRVKQAEAEQMVAALKERNMPHEYLLFPDEGHNLAKSKNRLKFYAHAEKFLARHLGGRYQH